MKLELGSGRSCICAADGLRPSSAGTIPTRAVGRSSIRWRDGDDRGSLAVHGCWCGLRHRRRRPRQLRLEQRTPVSDRARRLEQNDGGAGRGASAHAHLDHRYASSEGEERANRQVRCLNKISDDAFIVTNECLQANDICQASGAARAWRSCSVKSSTSSALDPSHTARYSCSLSGRNTISFRS